MQYMYMYIYCCTNFREQIKADFIFQNVVLVDYFMFITMFQMVFDSLLINTFTVDVEYLWIFRGTCLKYSHPYSIQNDVSQDDQKSYDKQYILFWFQKDQQKTHPSPVVIH